MTKKKSRREAVVEGEVIPSEGASTSDEFRSMLLRLAIGQIKSNITNNPEKAREELDVLHAQLAEWFGLEVQK